MASVVIKPLFWVTSSKEDLRGFPDEVKDVMGYALYLAQIGEKHQNAKPMKGFRGAGVVEIVEEHDGATYRGIYTVKFAGAVYVLHAFKKKSKKGNATPKKDLEWIKSRLKQAREHYTGGA